MPTNYITYQRKRYSNRSLTKSQSNDVLLGADIDAWDIAVIKGKRVMAQTAYCDGNDYLITYEIPKRKSILEDEDALETWMDRHIIGVYKRIINRK